ncbi:MAG: methyltransferase domain-containing protein [Myxococcota bacterium]
MTPRIVPLLSALLLTVACDNAKTEAKKSDDGKKTAKAGAADQAKADKADAKTGDKAEAKDGDKAEAKDGDKTDAEKAKADEERKARMAKRFAEIDEWKAKEKTRWTDEIESGVATLVAAEASAADSLKALIASPHRLPDNVERDKYRHPAETLAFFGIEPSMTVIEVGPGWGWYTELLAPMLANKGKLVVTAFDPDGPEDKGRTIYGRRFQAFSQRSEAAYGKIDLIVQGEDKDLDLGAKGEADVVFIVRGMHGWVNRDVVEANLREVNAALKPGGTVAVVQHRAKEGADAKETSKQGYLPQAYVVEQFEKAGFTLAEASEINANPKDTTDHPEGVWTLPPTLALGDTDKDKYLGIGESDRMTLRFQKK